MIQYISNTIRQAAMNDPTLFSLVENRVYQQRVDLGSDKNVYPLLAYTWAGGFNDYDGYPSDQMFLDCFYISENSLDECLKIYSAFHDIINLEYYGDPTEGYCRIREVSKPVDASALFQDKLIYTYVNTYGVKTVEK